MLSANDFAAVTWLSVSGEALGQAVESVLTVSSKNQNTGMAWNAENNSVQSDWGQQPTEQFPMVLSMELTAPTGTNSLRVYPLSPTGEEGGFTVYAPASPGKFVVDIDQSSDQSLWFGVEASPVSAVGEMVASNTVSLSPNPASSRSVVEVSLKKAGPLTVRLLDAQGRLVRVVYQNAQPVVAVRAGIETGSLAAGTYLVECRAGDWVRVEKLVVD